MNAKVIAAFQKMIDVNTPIIYIHDYDFVRVDALIRQVVPDVEEVYEWNPGTGETDFWTKGEQGNGIQVSLEDFLRQKYTGSFSADRFLVLREVHPFLDQPEIKTLISLIAQRKLYGVDYETTIIIVSSVLAVPREIEKFVSYLEIGFPDEEEINALIDEHISVNKYNAHKFTTADREKLMPSLKGMTAFEIDRMLDMAMSSNGSLSAEDTEMILRQKKQMVKKSGLLELVDTPENLDSIGGMDALKNYLKKKEKVLKRLTEAQKRGVAIPKGVFIVGMPGCGKSLCAKASAALFGTPLLKLDMGSMMDKYVGQSEANLRSAIKIAEAAAPCVLWIDEIEKAFSGIGRDNDILTRMYGYLLSWLQDKQSSVYVIATANNANCVPPELKRKGRFDEIFCVNLPSKDERRAIFDVHLKKRKLKLDKDHEDELLNATEGFNGADIESVVNEALEDCFINNETMNYKKLTQVAKTTVSISKSCGKQIEAMKKLFEENSFKDATKGTYTKQR